MRLVKNTAFPIRSLHGRAWGRRDPSYLRILRAIVAVFWYGVQVYFASTALTLLIHAVTGTSGGAEIMGLTAIGWLSFLIVWAIHIYVFWQGMGWVEKFLNFAGPFVYAVMIALVVSAIDLCQSRRQLGH